MKKVTCKNCFGKGYSTVDEDDLLKWIIGYWRGGEFGMKIGDDDDVEINIQAPLMRFCSCERGEQLKDLIEKRAWEDKRLIWKSRP